MTTTPEPARTVFATPGEVRTLVYGGWHHGLHVASFVAPDGGRENYGVPAENWARLFGVDVATLDGRKVVYRAGDPHNFDGTWELLDAD